MKSTVFYVLVYRRKDRNVIIGKHTILGATSAYAPLALQFTFPVRLYSRCPLIHFKVEELTCVCHWKVFIYAPPSGRPQNTR